MAFIELLEGSAPVRIERAQITVQVSTSAGVRADVVAHDGQQPLPPTGMQMPPGMIAIAGTVSAAVVRLVAPQGDRFPAGASASVRLQAGEDTITAGPVSLAGFALVDMVRVDADATSARHLRVSLIAQERVVELGPVGEQARAAAVQQGAGAATATTAIIFDASASMRAILSPRRVANLSDILAGAAAVGSAADVQIGRSGLGMPVLRAGTAADIPAVSREVLADPRRTSGSWLRSAFERTTAQRVWIVTDDLPDEADAIAAEATRRDQAVSFLVVGSPTLGQYEGRGAGTAVVDASVLESDPGVCAGDPLVAEAVRALLVPVPARTEGAR